MQQQCQLILLARHKAWNDVNATKSIQLFPGGVLKGLSQKCKIPFNKGTMQKIRAYLNWLEALVFPHLN